MKKKSAKLSLEQRVANLEEHVGTLVLMMNFFCQLSKNGTETTEGERMTYEDWETKLNTLRARMKEVESPEEKVRILIRLNEIQGKMMNVLHCLIEQESLESQVPLQDESRD